jgi:predicted GNAT family acetyltransferase
MEALPTQYDVHHNLSNSRFEINLGGGTAGRPVLAIAEYSMCGVGEQPSDEPATAAAAAAAGAAGMRVLDLYHTEVPPAGRGKGVADQLLAGVFRHAQEAGVAVRPSCSYVRDAWLPRHPEYKALCESELVAPACVERTVPSAAEAAAMMEGSDDDEEEDEEWGERALLNMQGHTFRLARNQYEAEVAELCFEAEGHFTLTKTRIRLGQLLLNRVLELLPRGADPNVNAEIKQHVRDAQAIAAQVENQPAAGASAASAGTDAARERSAEHRKFLATLAEAEKLL